MIRTPPRKSTAAAILGLLELIYHSAVRDIRKGHRNALVGLLLNMLQSVIFIGAFYAMFQILGMRRAAIRGDFLLYIMSGVFLFMTHTKAMGAVFSAEGPTSAMMNHAPLNSVVTISAAALSALYKQVLSLLTILYVYHVVGNPIEIEDPVGAFGVLLIAWLSGVAIGMIFLSMKPWFPNFTNIAQTILARVNMIASGKMFVVNNTPESIRNMFDWNPLFHCIDQERGYVFLHYTPYYTSVAYPVYVSLGLVCIGMMAEFYTRKQASVSWGAGH